MQLQAVFLSMASLVAVPFAQGFEDFDSYMKSCGKIELVEGGSVLQMLCAKNDGMAILRNKLDLNKCLGVDDDGKLAFMSNGLYAAHCDIGTCSYKSPGTSTLACDCRSKNETMTTEINLDDGIGNKDGTLVCDGGEAQVWEATKDDLKLGEDA